MICKGKLAGIVILLLLHSISGRAEELTLTDWQYRWLAQNESLESKDSGRSDWQPLPGSQMAPGRKGDDALLLRTRLPPGHWRDPVVFIPGVLLSLEVYLDGVLTYSFNDPIAVRATPWHMIPVLPSGGQLLLVRIDSNYSKIGLMGKILIGDRAGHLQSMIRRDFTRLGFGFFFLMLGGFTLLINTQNRDIAYYAFAVHVIAIAGYTLRYTHIKQLLPIEPGTWFYIWSMSLLLVMVTLLLFVREVFGSGRWQFINKLFYTNAVISLTGFIILVAGAIGLAAPQWLTNATLSLIRGMFVISLLFILVHVGFLAFRGNTNARLLMLGLPLAIIFATRDALWALDLIPGENTIGHWGALFFVVSLATILARRYAAINQQLRHYSIRMEENAREKALLLMDLHDGIGSIMTNILYLAEIAARKVAPGSRQPLETISGLAEEGMVEIRSFMTSLDEETEDWTTLIANMRRYASHTLLPHGMKVAFHSSTRTATHPPSGLLSLNIFRIYKEALNNIVKHTQATRVSIKITISPSHVYLKIEDDGPGLSDTNGWKHRGLTNMAARADRLGGHLEIRGEKGVTIECTLPIAREKPILQQGKQEDIPE